MALLASGVVGAAPVGATSYALNLDNDWLSPGGGDGDFTGGGVGLSLVLRARINEIRAARERLPVWGGVVIRLRGQRRVR